MKKTEFLFFIFLALFCVNIAYADFEGDGFYRLQNFKSLRYGNMIDNTGKLNVSIMSLSIDADYHSVQMISNGNQFTEPGSVIYVERTSRGYNLYAAGTSTYEIVNQYFDLKTNGTGDYGTKYIAEKTILFVTAQLEDEGSNGFDHCQGSTNTEYKNWYLHPIDVGESSYLQDVNVDEYFGVAPTYKLGKDSDGKDFYYTTIRLSFSCKLSANVHAFTMTSDGKITQLNQSSTIPANTTIILQCKSTNASDNRLYPAARGGVYTTESSITSGLYSGTKYKYFKTNAPNAAHYNGSYPKGQKAPFGTTPIPSTLRTLTVTNGKLGFIETFASVYPNDLCINGELAYFDLATTGNDANGGMTIVETPTITPPAETEVLVGESLTFNATFAAKAQRPNIKLQYSLDGQNWTETDGTISITSATEKNGTLYVRTYNGGIPSDVVTANYSFVSPIDKTLKQFVDENLDNSKYYRITNNLTVAYVDVVDAENSTIYAKDEDGTVTQSVSGDEIDFMADHYPDGNYGNYSNWVGIKVTSVPTSVKKGAKLKNVTGKIVDTNNPTIQCKTVEVDSYGSFTPKTYSIANFSGSPQYSTPNNHPFFFATPKANEICDIVWAEYDDDGTSKTFNVPVTDAGLSGSVNADFSLYPQNPQTSTVYKFLGLVLKTPSSKAATTGYTVYPLEQMNSMGNTSEPTGISNVNTGNVVNVKYYNVMGVESSVPFNGVNIVVTTYDNGTRSTSKVIR